MRRIRGRAHTKSDDIKSQIDTAWALGMRAGIDEGRRQMAHETAETIRTCQTKVESWRLEMENCKSLNAVLTDTNLRQARKILDLEKQRKDAEAYAQRPERRLDPTKIQTTLIVKSNGTPFNEETNPQKGNHKHAGFNVAGTETGRYASARSNRQEVLLDGRGRPINALNFSDVRPRGRRFSGQTPESVAEHANRVTELAAAYGASRERQRAIAERGADALGATRANGGLLDPEQSDAFIQRMLDNPTIIGTDEAEGPDQTVIAGLDGNGEIVRLQHGGGLRRVDSLTSLQEALGRDLAQHLDDQIMSEYGQDESAPQGAIRFDEPDEPGVVRDDQGEVVAVYDPQYLGELEEDAVGEIEPVGNPVTAENAAEAFRMLTELAYSGTSTREQTILFLQRRELIRRRFPESFTDEEETNSEQRSIRFGTTIGGRFTPSGSDET